MSTNNYLFDDIGAAAKKAPIAKPAAAKPAAAPQPATEVPASAAPVVPAEELKREAVTAPKTVTEIKQAAPVAQATKPAEAAPVQTTINTMANHPVQATR